MKTIVFYQADGRITRVRSGDDQSINAELELAQGKQFLLVDEACDLFSCYVDGGEIYQKPDQPDEYHEFDYASKQWVFSLDSARALKWQEIKAARTAQEFGTFIWGDYTFQCDEVSQRRIQGAVQLAAIDSGFSIDWTLADNSVVNLSAQDMISIGVTLAAHVNACHEKSRSLRQAIDLAQTEQDIAEIDWQNE